MLISPIEGASVLTDSAAEVPETLTAATPMGPRSPQTPPAPDTVQHMLFGTPAAVRSTIKTLHKLHYADATDWSKLMPTGRVNEVMAILTKKVRID